MATSKYGSLSEIVAMKTQGETQTKKVWGSPAPERERERREEKKPRRRRNQPYKKKRGGIPTTTKYGSGL